MSIMEFLTNPLTVLGALVLGCLIGLCDASSVEEPSEPTLGCTAELCRAPPISLRSLEFDRPVALESAVGNTLFDFQLPDAR